MIEVREGGGGWGRKGRGRKEKERGRKGGVGVYGVGKVKKGGKKEKNKKKKERKKKLSLSRLIRGKKINPPINSCNLNLFYGYCLVIKCILCIHKLHIYCYYLANKCFELFCYL